MAPEMQSELDEIVERVHRQNRRLRFWATPDSPEAWSTLVHSRYCVAALFPINSDRPASRVSSA